MNKKEKLQYKLKELLNEYSISEIFEVLNEIDKNTLKDNSYSDEQMIISESKKNKKRKKKKSKSIHEQQSNAVAKLKKTNQEKYELLSVFDIRVRKRELLPNLLDIRKLGKELSKDFPENKSRRQLISQLMNVLVEKPIEEIKNIISKAISISNITNDEYQKLAEFIITGNKIE